MSTPDLHDIAKDWLKAHGFDGLCNDDECGCMLSDLMPCGEPGMRCVAGYTWPAREGDVWIAPEKPKPKEGEQ